MSKPVMSFALFGVMLVMAGCQGASPAADRVSGVATPVMAPQGSLSARVQVGFEATGRRLMQIAGGGYNEGDVTGLDVELVDETVSGSPVSVYSTTIPRPANGVFAFTLNSLSYSKSYRIDLTAKGMVNGNLQPIGTGQQPFNTSSPTPVQVVNVAATVQLNNRTYQGEAPVGVAFNPGNLVQPLPSPIATSLFVPAGLVSAFAGNGAGYQDGPIAAATFSSPAAVAFDAVGNMYVADAANHCIRKWESNTGNVVTLAGGGPTQFGFTDATGTAAKFYSPVGLAVAPNGDVFVADYLNHRIRKVTSTGVVTTLAGGGTAGSANGVGSAALFNFPTGITLATDGNLYVADSGNHLIRKLTMGGDVTTLAGSGTSGSVDASGVGASFNTPYGIASDRAGNLYVSDADGNRIRKVTLQGVVSTFAGNGTQGGTDGASGSATFDGPHGLAVDAIGQVYVAERHGQTIRRIRPNGNVSTLAGQYTQSGTSTGFGAVARFMNPRAVAIAPDGRLFVADLDNHRICKVE